MDQNTKPAPFSVGDHVRYIAAQRRELAANQGHETELVLVPGMTGVVMLSTGALAGQTAASPKPWRCQVQFQNGFQFDITPENCSDFEVARGAGASTA